MRKINFVDKLDAGLILAAGLALFAVQALFKPGLPTSADLMIHLYRALEFEQAWAPGVIVPRWAPNLAYGYGYPLFIFAPPLPYLLALGFHATGFSLELAFKLLLIGIFGLYALGMYLLARDLFKSVAAGLVAAVAYTYAPFALREALLYGGNVPQFLAIGLFPWALWAVGRAIWSGRWPWTVLAGLFFAGITLSHLFQVLIFAPVFGLYSLLLVALHLKETWPSFGRWPARLRTAIQPLLAAPLGLLLSAFFWLPAFIERHHTRAQADIYLEKSPFFVRYPYWPELIAWIEPLDARAANPYVPLTLGVVTLGLAGLGLLAGLIKGRRDKPLLAASLFFALVAAGATFMTLPVSRPVWEIVEILQVAEFPWRMLGLANLGLAVLAGAALLLVPVRFRGWTAAGCIVVQMAAIAPLLYPTIPFTRFGTPTIADQIRYERSSQSVGTTTVGEYLPLSVHTPPSTSPLVEAFLANQYPERLDRASLPAGVEAELLMQNAVTHRYRLAAAAPFTLRFFHFDFPGWQAELDGQPAPLRPEDKTGLILIDIPAGEHVLDLHFGETPVRLAAITLSGLALVSLLGLAWLFRRWPGPASRPRTPPRLRLTAPAVLLSLTGIGVVAGVMPWLRPLFTIESPPDRALPAQHAVADVRFANGIQLIGYDLSRTVAPPGGYLQVTLYWQTDSAPYRDNLQPFVHLDRLDDFTTIADATNYTPGDVTTETNMPTFHWDNARYVRDEHDLVIPPEAAPLAYAVRVGLIDPAQGGRLIPLADSSGDTVWLDTINVQPGAEPPLELGQPLAVEFSSGPDTIQLTGFELAEATPERLAFTLAWRSAQRPERDYTVFAQLLDAGQRLAASYDSPPLAGAYPTSRWLPGQTVPDSRFIPLADVPPGQYSLIVGWYDPASGQRLVTPAGADFVRLTDITLTGEPAP